jgi:hypothetical protein
MKIVLNLSLRPESTVSNQQGIRELIPKATLIGQLIQTINVIIFIILTVLVI